MLNHHNSRLTPQYESTDEEEETDYPDPDDDYDDEGNTHYSRRRSLAELKNLNDRLPIKRKRSILLKQKEKVDFNVTWYLNDSVLVNSTITEKGYRLFPNGTLKITTNNATGIYRCAVTNNKLGGMISREVQVVVPCTL